jgi:hypothetical protein
MIDKEELYQLYKEWYKTKFCFDPDFSNQLYNGESEVTLTLRVRNKIEQLTDFDDYILNRKDSLKLLEFLKILTFKEWHNDMCTRKVLFEKHKLD